MNKKGQALVEFIIILPIFILLVFSAVDFGRIIVKKNQLESLTTHVVKMYEDNNTYEKIEEFLRLNDKNNTIEITNKDNYSVEFTLINKLDLITPGLNKILDNPYSVKVKRVIYYE